MADLFPGSKPSPSSSDTAQDSPSDAAHLPAALSSPSHASLHSYLSTHPSHTTRPLHFFYPTRAEFIRHPSTSIHGEEPDTSARSRWSSRASRKNRYTSEQLKMHRRTTRDALSDSEKEKEKAVPPSPTLVEVEQRLRHPHSRLKVHLSWDVSFWVAVTFVLGSSAWIANGFILYLPLSPTPIDSHTSAAAATAFVGGTLFEVGSYLMYVESLNTGHEELFGEELLGLVERRTDTLGSSSTGDAESGTDEKGRRRRFRWIGLGSFRELGFLASFIQLWAASIFWISTLTGLPGIIPSLPTSPPTAIADIFYWTPQVIGGTGFIVSSILLMVEVQRRWWVPNLRSLGWHVAVWNLIGAVGFTMCGALGYAAIASSKANCQSVMSTFWGSFAFMVGSCIQQWEAVWREDPNPNPHSSSVSEGVDS